MALFYEVIIMWQNVLIYAVGLILVLGVLRLLAKPIKFILKILFNALIGGAALFLVNHLGLGIVVGINPFTALVCGVLGIPGFFLIIALKLFFG